MELEFRTYGSASLLGQIDLKQEIRTQPLDEGIQLLIHLLDIS